VICRMKIVHRNALPFYWEQDNDTACLLIHGFTGSPSDLRMMGGYLKEKGYGISGLLLPGHGTIPEDMLKTTWFDWYRAVEEEYLKLKEKYKNVIPVGFSMGGLLSLHLASCHSVAGFITLSAPIFLGNRRAYLAPLLKLFNSYHDTYPVDEWEKEIEEGKFYYNRIPLNSLNSLLGLIRKVKRELPGITPPVLIMQSWLDGTVNPKSAQYIYDRLGSRDKRLVWLEKSGHVITLGPEREKVFAMAEEFVGQITAPNVNRGVCL